LPRRVRVKAVFADGAFGDVLVDVPVGEPLPAAPVLAPTGSPKRGEKRLVVVGDVGADEYSITVDECREHSVNGTDPCQTVLDAWFARQGAALVLRGDSPAADPKLVTSDGKTMRVASDQTWSHEHSVRILVLATRRREVGGLALTATTLSETDLR